MRKVPGAIAILMVYKVKLICKLSPALAKIYSGANVSAPNQNNLISGLFCRPGKLVMVLSRN
jgi:hypothetical protein